MQTRLGFIAQMPQGGDVPAEFQVFPAGRVTISGSDPFTVDDASMLEVVRKFRERGVDMVVDYEHQTEGGEFSSPDGTAPAAGWIRELQNRGKDGLWAVVEWTDRARELLANRQYRYYSPVFLVSEGARKLVELLRVALTNAPRLNWIKPIVAKHSMEEEAMEFLKAIAKQLGLADTATREEVTAKLSQVLEGRDFQVLVARAVGLSDAATGAQVIAGIREMKKPDQVACKEVCEALGVAETAGRSEVVATIHALRQRPDAGVLQEVAALKARMAERDRDEAVAAAIKAGKITPAQREWAEKYALSDPEGFRLFVAKAPQVAPSGGAMPLSTGGARGIEDAQLEINKLMGLSDEAWKKYNPPQA